MTDKTMTTPQEDGVAKWMESQNYEPWAYEGRKVILWRSPTNPDMTTDQAIFMHQAIKRAELEAEIRIHSEYWHSHREVSKNGIKSLALANKKAAQIRLKTLEGGE